MALVSVFVPAYNVGKYLSATIQSVMDQTFTDWELIILDDASVDNTFSIGESWALKDTRVRLFRNEQNLGMLKNWNKGIELCTAPFFVKLDGDDLWHPEMLERSLAILNQDQDVALVFSRFVNIDENGDEIEGSSMALPEFARNRSFSCVPLVRQGPSKLLSLNILRKDFS